MFGMSIKERAEKQVVQAATAALLVQPIESANLKLSDDARALFYVEAVGYKLHGLSLIFRTAFGKYPWATVQLFTKWSGDGAISASAELALPKSISLGIARRLARLLVAKCSIDESFEMSVEAILDIDEQEIEDQETILAALKNGTNSYYNGVLGVFQKKRLM
jgi:hypothetical protein